MGGLSRSELLIKDANDQRLLYLLYLLYGVLPW